LVVRAAGFDLHALNGPYKYSAKYKTKNKKDKEQYTASNVLIIFLVLQCKVCAWQIKCAAGGLFCEAMQSCKMCWLTMLYFYKSQLAMVMEVRACWVSTFYQFSTNWTVQISQRRSQDTEVTWAQNLHAVKGST